MSFNFGKMFWMFQILFIWPTEAEELCPTDWHGHDYICVRVYSEKKIFYRARLHCKEQGGHLVHILSKNMDDFVKELLRQNNVKTALIGLDDRAKDGMYKWGSVTMQEGDYRGWEKGSYHVTDKKESVVAISSKGWSEVSPSTEMSFVCQKSRALPEVRISKCPPVVEKTGDAWFYCEFSSNSWTSLTWTSATSSSSNSSSSPAPSTCWAQSSGASSCNGTASQTSSGQRVHSGFYLTHPERATTTLTCSVTFRGTSKVQTASCAVDVYYPPDPPDCEDHLVANGLEIRCITRKVYPEAVCTWTLGGEVVEGSTRTTLKSFYEDGVKYFTTDCYLSHVSPLAGSFTYTLTMKPNLTSSGVHSASKKVTFSVYQPKNSPEFSLGYGSGQTITKTFIIANEGEDLTLSCSASGGRPEVHMTKIACGPSDESKAIYVNKSAERSTVTLPLGAATRDMNGWTCTCTAHHIVEAYKGRSEVVIRVLYPASVTSFMVNGRYKALRTVPEGQITWACKGEGNPIPNVRIVRALGDKTIAQSAADVSDVETSEFVGCEDWGRYDCYADNRLTGPDSIKSLELKVKCKAQYCDNMQEIVVPTSIGRPTSFQACLLVYPSPLKFTLMQEGMSTASALQVSFNYTTMPRGILLVDLGGNLTEHSLGNYSLNVQQKDGTESTLSVNLVLKQAETLERASPIPVIVPVAVVIAVVIMFIIVIIAFMVFRRRIRTNSLAANEDMSGDDGVGAGDQVALSVQGSETLASPDVYAQVCKTKTAGNEKTIMTSVPDVIGVYCNAGHVTGSAATGVQEYEQTSSEKTISQVGRVVTEEGLVYVTVDLKSTPTKAPQRSYEQVEYTSISNTATASLQKCPNNVSDSDYE